jgi:hypothetical protein
MVVYRGAVFAGGVNKAHLIGFLVAYEPALTGIAVHEWLSLAFASALLVHLLFQLEWVIQVTLRFFSTLFHSSRLNYVLNMALLIDFVMIVSSVLLISRSVLPSIGLQIANNPSWRFLHSSSADFSLLLIGLHIALHWKWRLSTSKRFLFAPLKRRTQAQALLPAMVAMRERKSNEPFLIAIREAAC